jgi:hypothetical protein
MRKAASRPPARVPQEKGRAPRRWGARPFSEDCLSPGERDAAETYEVVVADRPDRLPAMAEIEQWPEFLATQFRVGLHTALTFLHRILTWF